MLHIIVKTCNNTYKNPMLHIIVKTCNRYLQKSYVAYNCKDM